MTGVYIWLVSWRLYSVPFGTGLGWGVLRLSLMLRRHELYFGEESTGDAESKS